MPFVQALYNDNPVYRGHLRQAIGARSATNHPGNALRTAIWEYESDRALMDYDALADLATNTIVESNEKYLIVDAPGPGGDRIVFHVLARGFTHYRTGHQDECNGNGQEPRRTIAVRLSRTEFLTHTFS